MALTHIEEHSYQRQVRMTDFTRHLETSVRRVQEAEGVYENTPELLPVERLMMMQIIFASRHHKLHNLHKVLGIENGEALRNVPIVTDNPQIEEERINALQVYVEGKTVDFAQRPDLIALSKATKSFGRDQVGRYKGDQEYLSEVLDYAQWLWVVGRREEKSLKPKFIRNTAARHLPSIAQDIMVYRTVNGQLQPLHQRKDLKTSAQQLEYLNTFFPLDQNGHQTEPVEITVRDGVAIHDLFSDTAFIARREETLHYTGMSRELLQGYVYGSASLPENSQVRRDIEHVWHLFSDSERKVLFGSWSPEIGIDPLQTSKMNGALPNQHPLFWLANPELKKLLLTGDKEAVLKKVQPITDIVRGNTTHIPVMLRAMIQTLSSRERTEKRLQSPESQANYALATAVNKIFSKRVLAGSVIDLTEYLSTIAIDDEYLFSTIPQGIRVRQ